MLDLSPEFEYYFLLADAFNARMTGKDDSDFLDRMDIAWMRLTPAELARVNAISEKISSGLISEADFASIVSQFKGFLSP